MPSTLLPATSAPPPAPAGSAHRRADTRTAARRRPCDPSPDRRRAAPSSGSSPSAPSGAGAGGSTAPGCCAGCGCSALCFIGFRFTKQSLCRPRRAVVTGNSLSHTKLAARTARVNSPARRARDVAVDERHDVSQRLLALRVVEDLVVHLRIPPHLDRTAQPVGERAGHV